jgi:hypothetical protein
LTSILWFAGPSTEVSKAVTEGSGPDETDHFSVLGHGNELDGGAGLNGDIGTLSVEYLSWLFQD